MVYEGVLSYNGMAVSHFGHEKEGYKVSVFRDERLRSQGMADFVGRFERADDAASAKKGFDLGNDLAGVSEKTAQKMASFGYIILKTSVMEMGAQDVYGAYKLRCAIEQLIDTMQNSFGDDTSGMHDEASFKAWSVARRRGNKKNKKAARKTWHPT